MKIAGNCNVHCSCPQELLVKTHNPTCGMSNPLEISPVTMKTAVTHIINMLHLFDVQACCTSLVTSSSRALLQ